MTRVYFFLGGTFGFGAVRGCAIEPIRPTRGCAAGVARCGGGGNASFGNRRDSEKGMLVERGC